MTGAFAGDAGNWSVLTGYEHRVKHLEAEMIPIGSTLLQDETAGRLADPVINLSP